MTSETSNVSDRLTEFASAPACDKALVLNYLGREVTRLTQADLPALQRIAESFIQKPEQTELNYYIERIQRGEAPYPYWIEKLKQMPEGKEEEFLKELFSTPVLNDKVDEKTKQRIIEGLKSCNITDQVLLAKIIIYFSPGRVKNYAKPFDFTDPKALRLLGMASTENYLDATYFLKDFPACDETCRLEMAKTVLPTNPSMFCYVVKEFGLKEQASLDELALLCSQSEDGVSGLYTFISKFGNLSKVAKEVAVNSINNNRSYIYNVVEFIKSNSWLDPAEKKEIGLLCAEKAPQYVLQIAELDENDKSFLAQIAKITLGKRNVIGLDHIVRKLDLPDRIELFRFGLPHFSNIISEAKNWFRAETEWKLLDEVEIDPDATLQTFKQFLAKEGFSFQKELEKIEAIKDPYAKEQSLKFLIEMVGVISVALSDEENKWVIDNGFAAALLSLQNPALRTLYLVQILQQAKNPAARAQFAALPGNEKVPWVLLTRVLYAELLTKGIDVADIQAFREKVEKGGFVEDNKKAAILLDTLLKLRSSNVKAVLQRIVRESKTNRDTFENICAVRNILDLNKAESLLLEEPLPQILQRAFQESLPLGDIEDFTNKLSQKFLSTRQPGAIITYIAKMKSLNDPKLLICLGEYIGSVLTGAFPEIRYRTESNPHLEQVIKIRENFLEIWKTNVERELPAVEAKRVLGPTLEWLSTKLIHDKHIKPEKLPHLSAYLQSQGDPGIEALEKSALQPWSTEEQFYLLLEIQLLKLCRIDPDDLKSQMKALQGIRQLAMGSKFEGVSVFQDDIKGRMMELKQALQPQEAKKYLLVNTDDPIDLLNCGTESPGSCQDVNGNPDYNKGLLGYLMDGRNRLLAVKDAKTGVIAARTMMKLLWDPKEQKPVLLLERIYGNNAHVNALVALAKETATRLGGIPVVFMPEQRAGESASTTPYPGDIEALGGPAPFEYSDATRGCRANGKYTVRGARYLQ